MGQADRHLNAADALKAVIGTYNTYRIEIINAMTRVTKETAKEEAQAVKGEAVKQKIGRGGGYIDGITSKMAKAEVGKATDIEAIIYDKNKPQIAHLLENGHEIVDRHGISHGFTKARPHFAPNEESFNKLYLERIAAAIEKAGV